MRDSNLKKSLGFAFISFHRQEDAEKARQECNHKILLKNQVRVAWKKNPKEFQPEGNIFVKGLRPETTY